MSKAFTRESDSADDDDLQLPPIPAGGKNYMTPVGYACLRDELLELIDHERPVLLAAVVPVGRVRPAPERAAVVGVSVDTLRDIRR